MNQQFQLPDNETIKKEWATRDAERRSTLDQLGYDVIDQPGGEPKIVKKTTADEQYNANLDTRLKELNILGKEQDLNNPSLSESDKKTKANKELTEDILNFYKAGKHNEKFATEKVLYPTLKQAYPELTDKELWDSIYNLRKAYE